MKRSELKQLIKEIIKASVNEAPMHVSKTDPEVANKFKQQVATIVSKSKMYKLDPRILYDLATEVYGETFGPQQSTSTDDLKKRLANNPAVKSVVFNIVKKSQDDIGGVSTEDVNELVSVVNMIAQTNQKRLASRRYSGASVNRSSTPWE